MAPPEPKITIPSVDYSDYSDRDVLDAVEAFKFERRNQGRTLARVVKGINTLGYEIERETFKRLEYRPLMYAEHVYNGVLNYAYAALEPTPVIHQDAYTYAAMRVIEEARLAKGYSYADLAQELRTFGIAITADEYRTCEQGTTKKVPTSVLLHSMLVLRLTPDTVFEEISNAYATGEF